MDITAGLLALRKTILNTATFGDDSKGSIKVNRIHSADLAVHKAIMQIIALFCLFSSRGALQTI